MVYPSSEWRQQSQCWQRQRETALQGALSFPMASLGSATCICIRSRSAFVCVYFQIGLYFLSNNTADFLAEGEYDYCFSAKNRGVLHWRIGWVLRLIGLLVISPFANRPIMEKWIQETVWMNMESLVLQRRDWTCSRLWLISSQSITNCLSVTSSF